MQIYLSTLTENDYAESLDMIEAAFRDIPHSNHDEHHLVAQLRKAPEYRCELEVVAKLETGDIIGHAMLSEVKIVNGERTYTALALAPVSVLPEYQQQGIGKALIQAVEERAKADDYTTVIVLGDPGYYHQLGYQTAADYDITAPFKIAPEYLMVKFLWDQLEKYPHGEVVYPESFN